MPPRVLQGSRPSSRSARGGPSLASHHTHALLFVGHACSRSARWPSLPQSSLYSPLEPAVVALIARTFSQGFGAPCLRAPGLRRPFAPSRPLQPWAVARLTPRSLVPPMATLRSLVDRPAQPRTCTTRPRRKADRVHVVHRPHAQARARAVAPRSPRGAGQQPAGLPKGQRRPPYRAHWPVSGRSSRYRASCAPIPLSARAGAEIHLTASRTVVRSRQPHHIYHDGGLRRLRPLPCPAMLAACAASVPRGSATPVTPGPTRPNNTRPNAPPVVVPHGRVQCAPRPTLVRSASVQRIEPAQRKGWRSDRPKCKPPAQHSEQPSILSGGRAPNEVGATLTGQRPRDRLIMKENNEREQQRTREGVTLGPLKNAR